jgi:hypothetical protein
MMHDETFDQQFVEFVIKRIVDNPDDVIVDRRIDELGVLLTLKINKADMGTVIGKNGQTAKALRTLLRVIGSKTNARINLKIVDPDKGETMTEDVTSDLDL